MKSHPPNSENVNPETTHPVLLPVEGRIEQTVRMDKDQLDVLIRILEQKGYEVIGPILRDSAIIFDRIHSADELPKGWTDEQTNATYRLKQTGGRWFGYSSTPASWKRFLFPPWLKLMEARRTHESMDIQEARQIQHRYAFLGMRPCDLEAVRIQDGIFLHGGYSDPAYVETRRAMLTIVVVCATPGGTCFCTSMGTGPAASKGFDLQLTEILTDDDHYFLLDAGSERGTELLSLLPHTPASQRELNEAKLQIDHSARMMGRTLDVHDLKDHLMNRVSDPEWEAIGQRCLACGNCTLVCPTCFCSTVEDMTDLTGTVAERTRRWDSCFTAEFSYIHGRSVRSTIHARYRQWLMHKLAFWVEQFGTYGCVGCGRCITWCPAGIDLTEEAGKIRERAEARTSKPTSQEV